MSKEEDESNLEEALKKISEAWKETKDHFDLEFDDDLEAIIKVPGWKDMKVKIRIKKEEDQDE